MKTIRLLFTALIACGFISCSHEEPLDNPEDNNQIEPHVLNDSFVNLRQIEDFASQVFPQTRGNGEHDFSINPIIGDNADTLMYIINFGEGDGWKIISADCRTPAIIAESEAGTFTLASENQSVRLWMDCIAQDLSVIRHSENEALIFSRDQIAANMAFWGRSDVRSLDPEPQDDGIWVVSTTSEEIIVEEVDHLTPPWYQHQPYNLYCPLKSNSSTERAPAGCVAVAGAEMLYYLHNHLGVPATMVSEGYCYGNINSFTRSFYSANTSIWTSMSSSYPPTFDSGNAVALMIGHIGALTGMHYNNSYSWTLPANLRTEVFGPMGISCSHGNYNADIVKSNLNNSLPVIVTATDLAIPVDFDIHCFIIDGYRKSYTKYRHLHSFIPNDPSIIPDPETHGDYVTYTYSSTDITAIKINWGWSSQWGDNPLNDGWYTLTDGWQVTNGGVYNYNHNRKIIYGFSISE